MKFSIPILNFKFLFIVIASTIASNEIQSQKETDTIIAHQYFMKGDSLLQKRSFVHSTSFFNKAISEYQKNEAWSRVTDCYNKISENLLQEAKYELLENNSKKTIQLCNKTLRKNSLQKALAMHYLGLYYRLTGKDDNKAIEYFLTAIRIKKENLGEDHLNIANSYDQLGLVLREQQKYKEALMYYNKALDIRTKALGQEHNDIIISLRNIGDVLRILYKFEEALDCFNKALVISENVLGFYNLNTAYLYFDLGALYNDLGLYDKSLEYFKKCLKIQESGLEKNKQYIAFTLSNIARNYKDKTLYNKALEYFKRELNLHLQASVKNYKWIGASLNNIGIVYRNNNENTQALTYFNKAYSAYSDALGNEHPRVSNVLHSIGLVHANENRYDEAIFYLNKALKNRLKTLGKVHVKISNTYADIGGTYIKKKEFQIALVNLKKAKEIVLQIYGKSHPKVANVLNQIALVHYQIRDYEKSIEYFEQALTANQAENNYLVATNINTCLDPQLQLSIINGKAKVYQEITKKNTEQQYVKESIGLYNKADSLIDYLRQNLSNHKDKISFAKNAKEIYTNAIQSNLLFYNKTKNTKALSKAFYFSEKSKSTTLKELLNKTEAQNFAGLPTNLLNFEKELRTKHAFYRSSLSKELIIEPIDTITIKNLEDKLFHISKKQDSLIEIFENYYPKFYHLKHKKNKLSIKDLYESLDNQTTILEFTVADQIIYVFSISKNNIEATKLSLPEHEEITINFRKSIVNKDMDAYKILAHSMYKQLIAPIKNTIVGNKLVIIPDGPLWHLNFDLLLTADTSSNNPKEFPYLLRDYAISYANSTNLLFNPFKDKPQSKPRQECLAFSFSDSAQTTENNTMRLATLRDSGDDLPGTRKEIKAISDIIDGQYYFGSEAIESNFKKNVGQFNILHLALHGEVDNERPENSKLYFTKSKDTIEDNLLYSYELFALDIPAELTVLSACNTGTGKIAKGEGIMSLGNAFQYAGTKSLLLTSWEVSDQTTPELMKYFYSNLKAGMNKAKALQQAKLQYLNTANLNRINPFYWGGFYLVGDASPIHFTDHKTLYWSIGLGVFGILLLIFLFYRKKMKN